MNMEEIKQEHEANGGQFFHSVDVFYGQKLKDFKLSAATPRSDDSVAFRAIKPLFRQQEVYVYNLTTKEIN